MTLTAQNIQQMPQTEKDMALYHVVTMGGINELNTLLDAGANPLVRLGAENENALILAALYGRTDVVNRLLKLPAVVAEIAADDNCALRWAAEKGYFSVVNRLLESPAVQAQITAENNYALRCAAGNDHLDVVNRLLEFPDVVADITACNNEALRWAACNGHLDVANRLLEFPAVVAEITVEDNDALRCAAGDGHLDVVNRLLEFRAVKAAMDDTIRASLTKHGFHEWQNTQRQQILSTIKGALHQGMPPELIMPILKHNHPSFSEAVLNKQIEFGKKQLREAMAAPATPLTFAAPATDSNGKKRKRDEDNGNEPTPKRATWGCIIS